MLLAYGLFHYGPDDFQHTLIGVLVTRNGRMQLYQIDVAVFGGFGIQVIRHEKIRLAAMIIGIGVTAGLHPSAAITLVYMEHFSKGIFIDQLSSDQRLVEKKQIHSAGMGMGLNKKYYQPKDLNKKLKNILK